MGNEVLGAVGGSCVILPRRREPNGKNNVRRRRIRLRRPYIYILQSSSIYRYRVPSLPLQVKVLLADAVHACES